MQSIRWPTILEPMALACLLLAVGACEDGIAGRFCEVDEDCAVREQCVAATCVSVCFGVTVGDGSAGSLCKDNGNCDSLECDNELRTSSCTCDACVPRYTDLGGTPDNPVIWEEKYTCVDENDACFAGGAADNNSPITFSLVQDGKNLTGTVVAGLGEGDVFEGEVCGNKFQWVDVTLGVVDPEEGCWTFTSDSFNKLSGVSGEFGCVGSGTRGAGSTPPDVISCQELGADPPIFTFCPPSPPRAPQDPP